MILGISGVATDPNGNRGTTGVGKDEIADHLEKKHHAQKVAMADPLKRICRDVYDFSVKQLWGPSQYRNEPDKRYPRSSHVLAVSGIGKQHCQCCGAGYREGLYEQCYLTPRYALQLFGTEWARHCFPDTWVLHAMRVADAVLKEGMRYSHILGLRDPPEGALLVGGPGPKKVVPIPDMRFHNEFKAIRAGGGKVVRVKRQVEKLASGASTHQSETELLKVPDEEFDYVIDNDQDLHLLFMRVDRMMDVFSGRIRAYDDAQKDVPPYKRE